ncbi:MAG: hypothetical protein HQL67_04960 [Magnetococcales bacterium]|nr:hypothetical protein [Magnetococcales bacterium]
MADLPPEPPQQPEVTPENQLRARRRKLLKGLAAGVPAVITLQSGAALAATSLSPCIGTAAHGQPAGGRCQSADPGTGLKFLADNNSFWTGSDGPGKVSTTGNFCAPYLTQNGSKGNAANKWGASGSASGDVGPAANYYSVTDSCWTSFY